MGESAKKLKQELYSIASPEVAEHSKRFFKTGKGKYGENDRFLGIRVPEQRKIAKKYKTLPLKEVEKLILSVYHEERLTALFILEYKYSTATEKQKKEVYKFYLSNLRCINNWDLIDNAPFDRIKECEMCGLLFLDKSKTIAGAGAICRHAVVFTKRENIITGKRNKKRYELYFSLWEIIYKKDPVTMIQLRPGTGISSPTPRWERP